MSKAVFSQLKAYTKLPWSQESARKFNLQRFSKLKFICLLAAICFDFFCIARLSNEFCLCNTAVNFQDEEHFDGTEDSHSCSPTPVFSGGDACRSSLEIPVDLTSQCQETVDSYMQLVGAGGEFDASTATVMQQAPGDVDGTDVVTREDLEATRDNCSLNLMTGLCLESF